MSTSIDPAPPIEDTVAIVGVGLIGGSIAAAVKRRGIARNVIGVGRSLARLDAAKSLGLIDRAYDDLGEAAFQASLIIFSTPVERIVEGVRKAAAACRPGTLITDAGSVKQTICDELREPLPAGIEFIGSHPLAGSEKQGYEAASAELFQGRVCVVTPTERTSPDAVGRVTRFWRALDLKVIEMTPHDHDHALAETSHFPHVAAAALATTLNTEHRLLAASGFRDSTRIASGDPDLWANILAQNAEEVQASLDKYARTLNAFRHALRRRDAAELKRLLEVGKKNRDGL